MIIQSSNKPIVVTLSSVISSNRPVRASLWIRDKEIKYWTNEDMYFHENYIELPLTQKETASFPAGTATLEIKWINAAGATDFSSKSSISIVERKDKVIFNGYN